MEASGGMKHMPVTRNRILYFSFHFVPFSFILYYFLYVFRSIFLYFKYVSIEYWRLELDIMLCNLWFLYTHVILVPYCIRRHPDVALALPVVLCIDSRLGVASIWFPAAVPTRHERDQAGNSEEHIFSSLIMSLTSGCKAWTCRDWLMPAGQGSVCYSMLSRTCGYRCACFSCERVALKDRFDMLWHGNAGLDHCCPGQTARADCVRATSCLLHETHPLEVGRVCKHDVSLWTFFIG